MRLGLLGLGRIGAFHAEILAGLPAVEELVLSDPVPALAEQVAGRLGARIAESPEAVLASGVDGMLIAAPTSFHAELIELCVAAGLPTFWRSPRWWPPGARHPARSRMRSRPGGWPRPAHCRCASTAPSRSRKSGFHDPVHATAVSAKTAPNGTPLKARYLRHCRSPLGFLLTSGTGDAGPDRPDRLARVAVRTPPDARPLAAAAPTRPGRRRRRTRRDAVSRRLSSRPVLEPDLAAGSRPGGRSRRVGPRR